MADVELLLGNYGRVVDDQCQPITVTELEQHLASTTDANTPRAGVTGEVADIRGLDQGLSGDPHPSAKRRWAFVLVGVAAAAVLVALVVLSLVGEDAADEENIFTEDLDGSEDESAEPERTPEQTSTFEAPVPLTRTAYFAAVAESALLFSEDPPVLLLRAGAEPRFDTASLGREVAFEPLQPDSDISADEIGIVGRGGDPDGLPPTGPIFFVGRVPETELLVSLYQESDGYCINVSERGSYGSSCSSRIEYRLSGNGLVFVPIETSVVAITTLDGQRFWQRPIGGWGLFSDLEARPEGSPALSIDAYDALGNQIGHWGSSRSEIQAWAASLTPILPLSSDEAFAVTDAYFAAYSTGDAEAVFSLLTPDYRYGEDGQKFAYFRTPAFVARMFEDGVGPWEQRFFMDAAQGTALLSPTCTTADDPTAKATQVTCVYDIVDAPTRAVDALPVTTTATFTMTRAGISEIAESYHDVDFDHVREPFRRWLQANRSEVNCVDQSLELGWCDEYASQEPERFGDVQQWTETGRLVDQYAQEWATYLETNGCTYLDGCGAAPEPAPTEEPETTPAGPPYEPPSGPVTGMIVPSDAKEPRTRGGPITSTTGTPLADIDHAVVADAGGPPLPLGSVNQLPSEARLDFLFEVCGQGWCARDANVFDQQNPEGGGSLAAGHPFHVRHGFVNEGSEPLGPGFDLALYVYPMGDSHEDGGAATGPTSRYTSDYIMRGEAEQCGPTYNSQISPVNCEWFVHDFPDGLPQGRWAIWAVWEAPCSAWVSYGLTDRCADPNEVMSFFSSGVDSPFH